jgi:hypothetical protein
VLVAEELCDGEREEERVAEVVKLTDTVGVCETLVLALGEGVPVKQSVGELVWVEEELTDTELQYVPDTLLHPDTVALAHWLTL